MSEHADDRIMLGEVYRMCQRIEAKVDHTNGSVRRHETRISILEDRAQQTKDPTARYTGLGAAVAAAGALIWKWVQP